jgi:sulfotransferase family protein
LIFIWGQADLTGSTELSHKGKPVGYKYLPIIITKRRGAAQMQGPLLGVFVSLLLNGGMKSVRPASPIGWGDREGYATDMDSPVRIAMWSGPRNISTALMRSWGNRPDTTVIDEPFYAFYLQRTGKPHPGATEIISQSETDQSQIVERLLGPRPRGKPVFYQKQMAHHFLPEIDPRWLNQVINCFLIRNPAEVITSYLRKNGEPALDDLGFVQQMHLFQMVSANTGIVPPVIDAADVLKNPRGTLELLCSAVGVKFDQAMLSWPPGSRDSDGVWAKYWYSEVERSTSFQPHSSRNEPVPAHLRELYEQCRDYYRELYQYRLH